MKNDSPETHAIKIMGEENVFGVKKAMEFFGVVPTLENIADLSRDPFPLGVLRELKNTHILVAVLPLRIPDCLEALKKKRGICPSEEWILFNKNHSCSLETPLRAEWWLIRKEPFGGNLSWAQQSVHVEQVCEEIPTAQVTIYAVVGYFLSTGKWLPERHHGLPFFPYCLRTSSLDPKGGHVLIEIHPREGPCLYDSAEFSDIYRSSERCIASGMRTPPPARWYPHWMSD